MADICSEAQLRAFLPAAERLEVWCPALNTAMERFQINSAARAAAFLAQVAHESSEFHHVLENLSYSAARLLEVWPRRFLTLDAALPYERQPEQLANYVYANRLGNGDPASGDGCPGAEAAAVVASERAEDVPVAVQVGLRAGDHRAADASLLRP